MAQEATQTHQASALAPVRAPTMNTRLEERAPSTRATATLFATKPSGRCLVRASWRPQPSIDSVAAVAAMAVAAMTAPYAPMDDMT